MPAGILAKDNFCSREKWDRMMTDEQWEEYKNISNLIFKIDYDDSRRYEKLL